METTHVLNLERSDVTLTIVESLDSVLTKEFNLENEQIVKQDFANGFFYKSRGYAVNTIEQLYGMLRIISKNPKQGVIRGISERKYLKRTRRLKTVFPEHPEGTNWVMVDVDGVKLLDGMDPLAVRTLHWFIEDALPKEFNGVKFVYQFSSSAGILNVDGLPLKSGLRVHLFFFFNRRIPGTELAAYLRLDTIKRKRYSIKLTNYVVNIN